MSKSVGGDSSVHRLTVLIHVRPHHPGTAADVAAGDARPRAGVLVPLGVAAKGCRVHNRLGVIYDTQLSVDEEKRGRQGKHWAPITAEEARTGVDSEASPDALEHLAHGVEDVEGYVVAAGRCRNLRSAELPEVYDGGSWVRRGGGGVA